MAHWQIGLLCMSPMLVFIAGLVGGELYARGGLKAVPYSVDNDPWAHILREQLRAQMAYNAACRRRRVRWPAQQWQRV